MKKLIDYIISCNRRLVFPVGGGSKERFNSQINTACMKPEEKLAKWMNFQIEEYGFDFVASTMPYVTMLKYFGLDTFITNDKNEYIYEGQIKNLNDLWRFKNSEFLNDFISNPYISCIKEFKKLSGKPIGGACFGPLTTVSVMIGVKNLCLKCISEPIYLENILAVITDVIIKMAKESEIIGADYFWVAEPVAVMLSPKHFKKFSGKYIKQIFDSISVPGFLHVPGDTNYLIDAFVETGAQCLSLDSFVDMRNIAYIVPRDVVILGNINSISMLKDNAKNIEKQVIELNEKIKEFPNFIVSSGGGLSSDTPEENLRVLFDVTKKFPIRW